MQVTPSPNGCFVDSPKERWRGAYAATAGESTWLAAHQWRYGLDVAAATARDVRCKLDLKPEESLLEIGSGSGAFLSAVLHEHQTGIGFDFCLDQVRAGRKFGVDASRTRVGVAEAAKIPMPSNSFDKVMCYSVVHYFPDDDYVRAAMTEMLRVCRVGGFVLLGDVAGVLERSRKMLLRAKCPAPAADILLWPLLPLRSVLRRLTPRKPREGRYFRRSALRRMLDVLPCRYEMLDQDIPGRPASKCRFDIRLTKLP